MHLEIRYQDRVGYDRDEFGQTWADIDRNGCDQRNDVLRRDMRKRHTKPGTNGCVLAKGVLNVDPHNYASRKVSYTKGDGDIEIDHVVSLRDAWKSGAEGWKPSKLEKFANHFMNLEAIDSETNQDKGDKAADQWLPKSGSDACYYVSRQVALKYRYRLTVTAAEKDVMVRVLNAPDCEGGEWEPDDASYFKAPKPKPIGEPKPKPKPTPERSTEPEEPSQPSVRKGVHPGAFCSPAGARGVTSKGTAMVCKGPGQPRWRAR